MNVSTALIQIKNLLGYPVVELETFDDMITTNIYRAFTRAKPRFNFTDFISLPNAMDNGYIDMTPILPKVVDVIHVYESPISKYSIVDPDVFYMRNFYNMMSMARLFMARSEIDNLVSKDFMFVNGLLFLNEYWGDAITVEATFDYSDPSQFEDTFFEDWITRYAVALTKQTLGRIRGKYKVRNAPYELDYALLLSEAKEEIGQLETDLEGSGGFFFVTR